MLKTINKIENLFFVISFGIATDEDFKIYFNWIESYGFKTSEFFKIKTYLLENFYPNLNIIYKEKLSEGMYKKLVEFLGEKNQKTQKEIIDLLTKCDEDKKYQDKLVQNIKDLLQNGNYDLENETLNFYLFIIGNFQSDQKKSFLKYEIFNEMGVKYNQDIEKYCKKIANCFNGKDEILQKIKIDEDKKVNNHLLLSFINLVNFFEKPLNEKQLKSNLQQILSIVEKFQVKSTQSIIEMIEKHLEQHSNKTVKFYEDIFEGLLPESLWNNNLNIELITNELKDIIIWIMKCIEKDKIKITEFKEVIKRNFISIFKILLEKDLNSLVAYCLLSLIYDSSDSKTIYKQYGEIIHSLNITPNIIGNTDGDKLIYSVFAFWLLSKEKEEQEEMNRISKIQINQENIFNNTVKNNIDIHCIFLYLNDSIRNVFLNKDITFQNELVNIIRDIHLSDKEYIEPFSYLTEEDLDEDDISYLNAKAKNNIISRIKIEGEMVNNVHEQITKSIKSSRSFSKIFYIECPQIEDTSIMNKKVNIIFNNESYHLTGIIIEENKHIKDILLLTKYTSRYYSLLKKKFLFSIELEYEKLYLVYFKNKHKDLNDYKGKQFIDKLQLKNDNIYCKVLKQIKDIVPKIKDYAPVFNNDIIEFEIVNDIEIKRNKINNKNNVHQFNAIKITEDIRQLISLPEKPITKTKQQVHTNINWNVKNDNSKILNNFESKLKKEYIYVNDFDQEIQHCLKQIADPKSTLKVNAKLVFYVSLMFFKHTYVDEELLLLLVNERLNITEKLVKKLGYLKIIFDNNAKCYDIEYLDNKIEIPTTESDKLFSFITRYVILIYRIHSNYKKYLTKEDILKKVTKLKEYKALVSKDIYDYYINSLNEYLEYNPEKIDNDIFFEFQTKIFLDNESNTNQQETSQNKEINEEKQNSKIMKINECIHIICDNNIKDKYNSELIFYIAYIIVHKNSNKKTGNVINRILINEQLQITQNKLDKLKSLQEKIIFNNDIYLSSLKKKLKDCTNKTDYTYAFVLNVLILIDYLETTNKSELNSIYILTIISELINATTINEITISGKYLKKIMTYFYQKENKHIIDIIQSDLNVFFTRFNSGEIDNNKEEYERVLSFILFHWNQNSSLNIFINNNLNNIKPMFELLFYFNKETEIADIIIFTLEHFNKAKLHDELNLMYKKLKQLLKIQFYRETEKSNSYLQYATILLFYYHKSQKNARLISHTQALKVNNSEVNNLLDVNLLYLYLNSEIRKMVLSLKPGISEKLINIFYEFQSSQQKDSATNLVEALKRLEFSKEFAFFDSLLNQKNVIQEISHNQIPSFTSKQLNELPYLLYVEFETKTLKQKSIEDFKYLPNNQEKKLELLGAVIYNGNINKYTSRICFIYDKISKFWYSIKEKNWQVSFITKLKDTHCQGIKLVYSKKAKLNNDKEITIDKLSLIKEKEGKSKYESIYVSSVNWFREHNYKIMYKYKNAFKLFSEFEFESKYTKTLIQKENPNCVIC